MACHLSHKLPWEELLEIYIRHKSREELTRTCPPKGVWVLEQFGWRLAQHLRDFRATDKSPDEEIRDIDPKRWGNYPFTMNGTCMGYYDSLLWGYLELNLLLLDPDRVAPLMMPDTRLSWALEVLCGWSGGSHPDNLATHLREAVENGSLKPFTPAVRKVLRDHAALMFRCMYSMSSENKLLEDDTVTDLTFGFFGWRR